MILLTGGTGFLGKRVAKKLLERKNNVRCLVRPGTPSDIFKNHLQSSDSSQIDIFEASFNDSDALRNALDGVDIVLHLAASTTGAASAQVANTVVGSENLFKMCVKEKISRFVLCSSFGVFGAAKVKRRSVISEATPFEEKPELRDPYSLAKIMQEELAWFYFKEHGLPLAVIRPGVIFGPPQPILSSRIGLNLFGIFLHLGNDNQIPLTYKDNCADAIISAGFTSGIEGEKFCIVDDDLPTSNQILKRYKSEIGGIRNVSLPFPILKMLALFNDLYSKKTQGHLPPVFTPYKVDSMWKGHTFTNQKAKEALNWKPEISMKAALDLTFDYFKAIN